MKHVMNLDPSLPNDDAVKAIGDSLHDFTNGYKALGRLGISGTRWELFRIRFWLRVNKVHRAQRIILCILEREQYG